MKSAFQMNNEYFRVRVSDTAWDVVMPSVLVYLKLKLTGRPVFLLVKLAGGHTRTLGDTGPPCERWYCQQSRAPWRGLQVFAAGRGLGI